MQKNVIRWNQSLFYDGAKEEARERAAKSQGSMESICSASLAYIFHTHPRMFLYEECCIPNRLK